MPASFRTGLSGGALLALAGSIKNSTGPGILNPAGDPLRPVVTKDMFVTTKVELQEMGSTRAREVRKEKESDQGSLF